MSTSPSPEEATAELDRLASAFTAAEQRIDDARQPLHDAIIKHLRARSAPPGKIANHTPYDRNHTGRLGKDAGVPSLRGPDGGPAPVYVADVEEAAFEELDRLTEAFTSAGKAADEARKPLHAAIVRHYAARTLTPGVISSHVPYDRNHVLRIARSAGAPRLRDAGGKA